MSKDRWYPNLDGVPANAAHAIRLLYDAVYSINGRTGPSVPMESPVTAPQSGTPSANELITRGWADKAYLSTSRFKMEIPSGRDSLRPVSGLYNGYPYFGIDTSTLWVWYDSWLTVTTVDGGGGGTGGGSAPGVDWTVFIASATSSPAISGSIDGSNYTFVVPHTPIVDMYAIVRNMILIPGDSTNGYTRSGTTIILGSNISPPNTGQSFGVAYIK